MGASKDITDIFTKDYAKHAEIKMIEIIEESMNDSISIKAQTLSSISGLNPGSALQAAQQVEAVTNKTLKMYINYSPCAACSKALITFKSQYNVSKIEIIAAAPYYCQQLSCAGCNNNAIPENTEGLRNLKRSDIDLRGFSYVDWVALAVHPTIRTPSFLLSLQHHYNTIQLGWNKHTPKPNDSRAWADKNTDLDFCSIMLANE